MIDFSVIEVGDKFDLPHKTWEANREFYDAANAYSEQQSRLGLPAPKYEFQNGDPLPQYNNKGYDFWFVRTE